VNRALEVTGLSKQFNIAETVVGALINSLDGAIRQQLLGHRTWRPQISPEAAHTGPCTLRLIYPHLSGESVRWGPSPDPIVGGSDSVVGGEAVVSCTVAVTRRTVSTSRSISGRRVCALSA
jgi:hypothetical protein